MNQREEVESLADYVRRIRNEKGLSLSDVEKQSRRAGVKIVSSYVSRIENQVAKNPSKDKLVALSAGLGVSEDEVFARARGKSLGPKAAHDDLLLGLFHSLPLDRQSDVMAILQHFNDQYGLKRGSSGTDKKKPPRAA